MSVTRVAALCLFAIAGCGGDDAAVDAALDADASLDADSGASADSGPDAMDSGTTDPCLTLDCDDGNDCTNDSCESGACVHALDDTLCAPSEVCDLSAGCVAGTPCTSDAECPTTDPCRVFVRCDASRGLCQYVPLDGDADGDPAVVCGGTDCDDSDPGVHPGASEACDGVDNDCDGTVDGPSATCAGMYECVAGACTCPTGLTDCGTAGCVDTTSNSSHCGGCRVGCFTTETCVAGTCECGAGTTLCGSTCADTSTDPAHCGGCDMACSTGATCASSTCACPAGTADCSGACTDTSSDDANCGSCGFRCIVGGTCGASICRPEVTWARRYRTADTHPQAEYERVGVTSAGSVLVAVAMRGSYSDPSGAGSETFTGSSHHHIIEWDDGGTYVTRTDIDRTTSTGLIQQYAFELDSSGNMFWGGKFSQSIRFGGSAGITVTSTTGVDGIVAKLNSTGTPLWAKRLHTASSTDDVRGVVPDGAGGVFAVGILAGDFDFGGGNRATGGTDFGFVAHYDSSGAHVASWRLPGTPLHVARNAAGQVFVAGYFDGMTDFGGGALTPDGRDGFVVRYSAGGTFQQQIQLSTSGVDVPAGVEVTSANIYVATSDALLESYAYDGTLNWSIPATMGTGTVEPRDLVLTSSGAPIVVGGSNGDYAYDGATTPGRDHGFVARYTSAGALDYVALLQSGELRRDAGFVHGIDINATGDIGLAGYYVTGVLVGHINLPETTSDDQFFVVGMNDPVP